MHGSRGFRVAAGASGLAVAALLASAAPQVPHGRGSGASVAPVGPAAEILRDAKGYRSWHKFARYETPILSKTHSANYVIAWYNDAAAPAVTAGAPAFPEGSIIVKENRLTADGPPATLSVMAKRGGQWLWISATTGWQVFTSEDGKPLAGDIGSCAGCHGEAPRDSVYSQ